jgi:hypothetical protein
MFNLVGPLKHVHVHTTWTTTSIPLSVAYSIHTPVSCLLDAALHYAQYTMACLLRHAVGDCTAEFCGPLYAPVSLMH